MFYCCLTLPLREQHLKDIPYNIVQMLYRFYFRLSEENHPVVRSFSITPYYRRKGPW